MKIGHILTRTKWHMTANPISSEDYFRNEVMKGKKIVDRQQAEETYRKIYQNTQY